MASAQLNVNSNTIYPYYSTIFKRVEKKKFYVCRLVADRNLLLWLLLLLLLDQNLGLGMTPGSNFYRHRAGSWICSKSSNE